MKPAVLVALTLSVSFAQNNPRLSYTKTFPGSTPEFLRLTLDSTGALEYSESIKKEDPSLQAKMTPEQATALFQLASQVGYFKTPLESGLKVANTGKKVFTYEDGKGGRLESTFNYSTNPAAQQLLAKFEDIAASERAYMDLDRAVHFDKLGVNDALAEVEGLWLRKQLAAPAQFFPLLTRIAKHESFMHLARDRAARLKEEFEKPVAESATAEVKPQ
jgi:hypothetical protein